MALQVFKQHDFLKDYGQLIGNYALGYSVIFICNVDSQVLIMKAIWHKAALYREN